MHGIVKNSAGQKWLSARGAWSGFKPRCPFHWQRVRCIVRGKSSETFLNSFRLISRARKQEHATSTGSRALYNREAFWAG